jgi:hypothetical protein
VKLLYSNGFRVWIAEDFIGSFRGSVKAIRLSTQQQHRLSGSAIFSPGDEEVLTVALSWLSSTATHSV